jgi:hypothetical protein
MIDASTESFISLLRAAAVRGEPCDEWTLADLQRSLGVELPPAYRAFLLIAGRGCAPLEGSRYVVDELGDMQREGRELARRGGAELPEDAFVCRTHQGFVCHFFLPTDADDPAVYECVEGPITTAAPSFTSWLLAEFAQSDRLRSHRS